MTLTQAELNVILEKHKKWLKGGPGGERANLTYANLTDANLARANLTYEALDFACLPLWCGSLKAHFDDRQIIQIVYHAVKAGLASPNVSDDVKAELRKVIPLANRFHRAKECGVIEE
jgi:uncharacterized protein YjbI with pentapeptide repeats